jgi:hypothetical protein
MRQFLTLTALLVTAVIAFPALSAAAEPGWRSVGVRGGFSAGGRGNTIYQFEGDAVYRLPWRLVDGPHWQVATQAEGGMGLLTAAGDYGLIASAGPSAAIAKLGIPLELVLGVSAAFLSSDTLGNKDFNGDVQFLSHAALSYRLGRSFGISYRFQHMSNAGLNGRRNPGANLHLFGIDWYLDQ